MAQLNGSNDVEAPYNGANGLSGTAGSPAIQGSFVDSRSGKNIDVEKVCAHAAAVCTPRHSRSYLTCHVVAPARCISKQTYLAGSRMYVKVKLPPVAVIGHHVQLNLFGCTCPPDVC